MVSEAFGSKDTIPLGTRTALNQGEGDSIYVPYPQPHARNTGIEHESKVDIHLHGPTGAVIIMPPEGEDG